MLAIPQTEAHALWRKRYGAAHIWSARIARCLPTRGIVISAISGKSQIYAWDLSSEVLRPLTHHQDGVFTGTISPDGCYVYYLHDEKGNEKGHYRRIPWNGGEAQDLTPDMPPYAALYRCAVSLNGTVFAFTPTEANGFPLYCLTIYEDGKLNELREM